MSNHTCLNCGQLTEMNYCGKCGQAAHTHRFSVKHIFSHDFMHGVFHFDKGFFYTTKELMVRPGHSIRSYVEGKRVSHFNYFSFIILLVAFYHLLVSASGFRMSGIIMLEGAGTVMDDLQKLWLENYKWIVLVTVPVYALFSFLIFRRARLNYAEHLVLNAYKQGGELLLTIIITLIVLPFKDTSYAKYLFLFFGFLAPLYSIWFYTQYFGQHYKNKYFLFQRAMLVHMLVAITVFLIAYPLMETYLKDRLISK